MALSGDTFQLVYKYLCYRTQISIKSNLLQPPLIKQYISAANLISSCSSRPRPCRLVCLIVPNLDHISSMEASNYQQLEYLGVVSSPYSLLSSSFSYLSSLKAYKMPWWSSSEGIPRFTGPRQSIIVAVDWSRPFFGGNSAL